MTTSSKYVSLNRDHKERSTFVKAAEQCWDGYVMDTC